jgi:glycosyltransferase involved in cell wall biosynthesis
MKILRVINSLDIGGAERSVVGNVPLHIQNGVDMEVLLLNGQRTFFLEELEKQNIKIHFLGKNNNVYNPALIFKISKYINEYDLIHVSLFPALYWVSLAKILTKSKTKLVFTEHNTNNRRMNNFLFRWIDKIIYKQYNHIVAISPETNVVISKHLNRDSSISTIYNGVDLFRFKNGKKKCSNNLIPENKKIILQIGGFRDEKDQDTVIKSLLLLPNEFHVVFVGIGKRMELCKHYAKSLNVFQRITFLGLHNNVEDILSIADVVVMSSHWEGFGRAAVEGMAASKPVIATNVSGLSSIVGGAGLLFEVGDHEKLAELIINLFKDKRFYDEISFKCSQRAEKYGIKNMVDQYEVLYKNMLAN